MFSLQCRNNRRIRLYRVLISVCDALKTDSALEIFYNDVHGDMNGNKSALALKSQSLSMKCETTVHTTIRNNDEKSENLIPS